MAHDCPTQVNVFGWSKTNMMGSQESGWISKVISLKTCLLFGVQKVSFSVIAIWTNFMLRIVYTLHGCSGNTNSFDFSELKIVSWKFMLYQRMNELQCGFVIIITKNIYVYCICLCYEVLSLFSIPLIIFLWTVVYGWVLSLSPDFYA